MNKLVRTPAKSSSSEDVSASSFLKISSSISLAANVVTVAGLIIVALQLYENQRITRAQTRHELASTIVTILSDTANNPQLASVIYRGSNGMPLTPVEQFQFEVRSNALLRYWEDVHYQFRMGLYDEEEFDRHRDAWAATIRQSKGFAEYWCRVRQLYSPAFANEMNALLPSGACSTKPA
ncbi:MAG: hypothetical protein QFC78_09310 [Pseudomonadota bacterium]|nr:hypothetical protein [Pseudomonadota bacterium]